MPAVMAAGPRTLYGWVAGNEAVASMGASTRSGAYPRTSIVPCDSWRPPRPLVRRVTVRPPRASRMAATSPDRPAPMTTALGITPPPHLGQMLDVERAREDPIVECGLPHLVAVQDRPQAEPAMLEEEPKQARRAFDVDRTDLMGDACGAYGAEAALAGAHAEPQLAAEVVEGGERLFGELVGEHPTAHQLALAEDLVVHAVVLAIVQAVRDVVVRRHVRRILRPARAGLLRPTAGMRRPELGLHRVDEVLGHQPVRGELATRDREQALEAVALAVVQHRHAAAHVAGVAGDHARVLDQRTCARPDMEGSRLAEARYQHLARVEHLLHLVVGDRQVVRIGRLDVGGADVADGVYGHDDVAVGGVDQPVHHAIHPAVVHRDHDAAARDDLYVGAAGHPCDLARPGTRAVEDEVAADPYVLAGLGVMAHHGGDRVAVTLDAPHLP